MPGVTGGSFDVLRTAVEAAGAMDKVCRELTVLQVSLERVPDSGELRRDIEGLRREAYDFEKRIESLATSRVARILQPEEAT